VPSTTLLWRAQAPSPSLSLLGSIHGLNDPQLPLGVVKAFERSEILIFETDVSQFDPAVLRLPSGRTLSQLISRQTYNSMLERAEELEVDPAELEEQTVPACAFRLTVEAAVRSGVNFGMGVDSILRQWAEEDGKQVAFLEPADSVHQALGRLPLVVQERWLAVALLGLPTIGERLRAAEQAWRSGDLEALERALLTDEIRNLLPEIGEALFASRNRRWANQLLRAMPSLQEALVVVGAGHFFEPDGLLSLLAMQGCFFNRG
jgi:uncharacterized protein YbaP (TraB family)